MLDREAPSPLRYVSKKVRTQYAVTASWRRPDMPSLPKTRSRPRTTLLFITAPSSLNM